jgi:hypothetical protein
MVEQTIMLYINGECHGYRVLQQDMRYQLQGKKIIKSVQQRILDYKSLVCSQVREKCLQIEA